MDKKYLIPILLVTAFVAGAVVILNNYIYTKTNVPAVPAEAEVTPVTTEIVEQTPEVIVPDPIVVETQTPTPTSPATFVGMLEEVNVGCFADGECYVVVDGVKVTVLRGWNSDTVGRVIGVDGFGEIEAFIGEEVEVSAREMGDGTFSLYGDESYYVKLRGAAGGMVGLGNTINLLGVGITPNSVLEDSRCPIDVTCVWAGTVRVSTTLVSGLGKSTQEFTLGVPVTTQAEEITLTRVDPVTSSGASPKESEYQFLFKVIKR